MRRGVLTVGVLVFFLGVAALLSGIVGRGFVVVFWGVALVAAIVFERFRYKRLAREKPGTGWERTTERFVDDETGKTVTVYVQPESGERTYVQE